MSTQPTSSSPAPSVDAPCPATTPPADIEETIKNANAPPEPYTAFSLWRQRFILLVVTVAGFFGPMAGGIYLPALPVLEKEFHASATAINLTVSVFMLTFAFAPLFWASFADWRGRRPLYLISLLVYIGANILLAAVPVHYAALVVLRILQAFGSAAVVSMGAGTVADITEPKRRAASMSIFLLGPQLGGPIIGPVIGGALTDAANWRWIFGFLAISGFVLWLLILGFLPETLRSRCGNGSVYQGRGPLIWPPTFSSPLAPAWARGPPPPVPSLKGYWRLFCYPPVGIVTVNTALLYSTYFAIAVDLPTELTVRYQWSPAAVGAGFLALGVAMIVGSLCGGRFSDWRRGQAAKAAPDGNVAPEFRLVDQIWGVLVCAAGCITYGWLVFFNHHPAGVLVATFWCGFGMNWVFVTTTAFLSETAPQQAAGAFALGNMLRNPGAAVSALIIPALVSRMGVGWCFTGLGIIDMILVGSAVLVLRFKSPEWRAAKEAKGRK